MPVRISKQTYCIASACTCAGPEPGLTRDVVRAALDHQGTRIELLDTAGYVGATKVRKGAGSST
jgi:predicted GTPase